MLCSVTLHDQDYAVGSAVGDGASAPVGQTPVLHWQALLSACAPPALTCHWLFVSRCKCSFLNVQISRHVLDNCLRRVAV